jgi:hypothetical protein
MDLISDRHNLIDHENRRKTKMDDPEIKKDSEETAELTEKDLGFVTGGAVDIFLNLEGIKGESQDDKHKDEIH